MYIVAIHQSFNNSNYIVSQCQFTSFTVERLKIYTLLSPLSFCSTANPLVSLQVNCSRYSKKTVKSQYFLVNLHTVFHGGWTRKHSDKQWMRSLFFHYIPANINCFQYFYVCHSYWWCQMIPHLHVDLDFSNKWWQAFFMWFLDIDLLSPVKCLFITSQVYFQYLSLF